MLGTRQAVAGESVGLDESARGRAGKPWPPQPPWEPLPLERAVAELVGEKAPLVVPPEFAYLGYHVEVEKSSAGWTWKAWRRGKHDGVADRRGGPERRWQAAVIAVKANLAAVAGQSLAGAATNAATSSHEI